MSGRTPRATRRERAYLVRQNAPQRQVTGRTFAGGTNRRTDLAAKLLGPPVHASSRRRILRGRKP